MNLASRIHPGKVGVFLLGLIIAGSRKHEQATGFLLLFLLMLLVAWYKWALFSGNIAPSGSDGGQWMAFGHQFFTGETVRAGFQFYPPIVPFAVQFTSLITGSFAALKIVGIFTSVLVAVPVYLLLRQTLSPWLSAALAITATLTPFNNEFLAFGGYPQLLGTSFLLFSTYFLLMGFDTGKKRWFLAAGLAASATVGSNILPAFLLVTTSSLIALLFFHKMWHQNRAILFRRFRTGLLWWFLPSIILSLPFIGTYSAYLSTTVSSTATPTQLTLMEMAGWANSAWLSEFVLWAGLAGIAGCFLILLGKAFFNNQVILTYASVTLLSATIIGVLLIRELRLLGLVEISLILTMSFIPRVLDSLSTFLKARQYLSRLIIIFTLALVLIVGTVGHRRLLIAYDWYHLVDTPVLAAFDWLRDNGDRGSIVVTTGSERGHNYGWWIEGYSHLPAYTAGDPLLFFSNEERAQVELAQAILIEDTSPMDIRALANENKIRFLFLDKETLERRLIDLYRAGFMKRFENDAILIMENKVHIDN
jgi:hypothetical protein